MHDPGPSCSATMVPEIQAPHVGFKFADRDIGDAHNAHWHGSNGLSIPIF
jgi:hypothetical protein